MYSVSGLRPKDIFEDKRDEKFPELYSDCDFFDLFTQKLEKCCIFIPETITFSMNKPAYWIFNSRRDPGNSILMKNQNGINIHTVFEKFSMLKPHPEDLKSMDQILNYFKVNPEAHKISCSVRFDNKEKMLLSSIELLRVMVERAPYIKSIHSIINLRLFAFNTRETLYCEYRDDPEELKEGPQVRTFKKTFLISDRQDLKSLSRKQSLASSFDLDDAKPEATQERNLIDFVFDNHIDEIRTGSKIYEHLYGKEEQPLVRVQQEIKRGYINSETKINYFKSNDHHMNKQLEDQTKLLVDFIIRAHKIHVRKIVAKFLINNQDQLVFIGCKEIRFTCLPNKYYNNEDALSLIGSGCNILTLFDYIQAAVKQKVPRIVKSKILEDQGGSDAIHTIRKWPLSIGLLAKMVSFKCRGDFCEFFVSNPEKATTGVEHLHLQIQETNKAKIIIQEDLHEMIRKPYEIPKFLKIKCRERFDELLRILKDNHVLPKQLKGTYYGNKYDEHDPIIISILCSTFNSSKERDNLDQLYSNIKVCKTCFLVYSLMSKHFQQIDVHTLAHQTENIREPSPIISAKTQYKGLFSIQPSRRSSVQKENPILTAREKYTTTEASRSRKLSNPNITNHNSVLPEKLLNSPKKMKLSETHLEKMNQIEHSRQILISGEKDKEDFPDISIYHKNETSKGAFQRSASVGHTNFQRLSEPRRVGIITSRLKLGLASFKTKTNFENRYTEVLKEEDTVLSPPLDLYKSLYKDIVQNTNFTLAQSLTQVKKNDTRNFQDTNPRVRSRASSKIMNILNNQDNREVRSRSSSKIFNDDAQSLNRKNAMRIDRQRINSALNSVIKVSSLFSSTLDHIRKLHVNKVTTPKLWFNSEYCSIQEFTSIPLKEFCDVKKLNMPDCEFADQIQFFIYEKDIGIPFLTLDSIIRMPLIRPASQDSSKTSNRVKVFIICSDSFDSFTEYIPMYKYLLQRCKNIKLVLFNIPGQAYTAYNFASPLNNEKHAIIIDTLLCHLQDTYKINCKEEDIYMGGFGFGANILSLLVHNCGSSFPNFKGLLLVNGFPKIDKQVLDSYIKMNKMLLETPNDKTTLPFNYFNILCGARTLSEDECQQRALINPISIEGRKFIIQSVATSIDISRQLKTLKIPLFIVHSIKDCFVPLTSIQSLIEGQTIEIDPLVKLLDKKMLRQFLESEPEIKKEHTRKSFFYDGPHNLLDEMPRDAIKIMEDFLGFS